MTVKYGESRVGASSPHNKMTQRILQLSTIKKLRALNRSQGKTSKQSPPHIRREGADEPDTPLARLLDFLNRIEREESNKTTAFLEELVATDQAAKDSKAKGSETKGKRGKKKHTAPILATAACVDSSAGAKAEEAVAEEAVAEERSDQGVDAGESTDVATGAVSSDTSEQPPSASSADPQPSPVDRQESDGEFLPVGRRKKHKRKDKEHQHQHHQHQPPPPPTRQYKAFNVCRKPPAGRGLGMIPILTNPHPRPHPHRGPPPLVPTAAVPPSMALSAALGFAPRPPHPPLPPSNPTGPLSGPSTAASTSRSHMSGPPQPPPECHRPSPLATSSSHAATASESEHLVDQLCRQLEQTQREARQRDVQAKETEETLTRQLQDARRKLAEMTVQQQQQQQLQPSAKQQEGEDHDDCDICYGEHGVASIMYVPCRHMRVCPHCYEDRKAAWQRELSRVKAENDRRREEKEAARRQNENLSQDKQISLVKLLDEPEYTCEHCKAKVEFAGFVDDCIKWVARPFK
ncbi:unnamed protein product [Vitrella brassicaformis CCMP3155]|uniref:Uncharacterized protein n=2 Tax=Vitrella brassicaformis TaxID=1169539 RepID=A0A0G4EW72_VITBC|nr:unnamed protein product [Vitrella brassicaformis CCMP3155]|eukprot:CEM02600.1 unnamed protein product [Vitrella brassicaformis CCMP3155]